MQKDNKIIEILIDGLILFAVSTVLVIVADLGFSKLKGKVPKDNPLVLAILQDDLSAVENALKEAIKSESRTQISGADEHGRTSLMRASYANLADSKALETLDTKRAPMIPLLLDHGADLNATDKDGWTALMWASWSGTREVAKNLLARNAQVTHADRQGNTALIIAAQRGNAGIVKLLVDHGANRTATNKNGQTALDLAKGAMAENPNRQDAYQETVTALGGS